MFPMASQVPANALLITMQDLREDKSSKEEDMEYEQPQSLWGIKYSLLFI
jgi:hypothetical protein